MVALAIACALSFALGVLAGVGLAVRVLRWASSPQGTDYLRDVEELIRREREGR
jgi:hypothetical protein